MFLILTATTNNTVMMERANLLVSPLLATTAILARGKTMLLCVSKVGYKTENVKLGFKSLKPLHEHIFIMYFFLSLGSIRHVQLG